MHGSIAFPLVATVAIAAVATSTHHRLPPRLAAKFVTIALALVTIAALPTALVVAAAYMAHAPVLGNGFEWCARTIGLHQAVPSWLGMPVVALIVLGTVRIIRLLRQYRSLRVQRSHPIHIAHSDKPYAVTLPGRAGQIVMSTALIDLLDDEEQRIIVAHEQAHARHRHDRYLLAAELAAAALPPLRGLAKRVSYSIERWADEVAGAACGDRRLVAITLGKVALRTNPPLIAGFSGLGVPSRMAALLEPPIADLRHRHLFTLWSSVLLVAGFAAYQLHHLERLLTALCPH